LQYMLAKANTRVTRLL